MLKEALFDPCFYPERDDIPEITITPHRAGLVEQIANMTRYKFAPDQNTGQPYPLRIIDNNLAHIHRTVKRALMLKTLNPVSRELLATYMELHDLPEVESDSNKNLPGSPKKHDMTALDKELNPVLAAQVAQDEATRAKEIFTSNDYRLWLEFESAKIFLEQKEAGGFTPVIFPPHAILAKIIDVADGGTIFHAFTADFIREHGLKAWDGAPYNSFDLDFRRLNKYQSRLSQIPSEVKFDGLYVAAGQELIDDALSYMRHRWVGIPEKDIPEILVPHLS